MKVSDLKEGTLIASPFEAAQSPQQIVQGVRRIGNSVEITSSDVQKIIHVRRLGKYYVQYEIGQTWNYRMPPNGDVEELEP